MSQSKNLSLFKISLLLLINLYFKNIYLLLLSIILVFIFDKKLIVLFLCLFLISSYLETNNFDFIKIGRVEKITSYYSIVDKVLYKSKIYNTNFEVGDYIVTQNSNKITDTDDLEKNILFTSEYQKTLISNSISKKIYKKINSLENTELKNLYKKLIYNEYIEDDNFNYYLGYGLSEYYLLVYLIKKNRYLGIFTLLLLSILFGFNTKLILVLVEIVLCFFKSDNVLKLTSKIIFLSILNINLFNNYSILITLIFSFLSLTNNIENKFFISLLQSFFFGEIQIVMSFLYKEIISIRIVLYILAILSLFISFLRNPFILMSKVISNVLNLISFGIRGKINIIVLILLIMFTKIFNIKNQYIKIVILIVVLISGLNNPFKHVSFIDVGQGDSILIANSLTKENILVDTGSKYYYSKLKKELFNQGIYKIDYLIITHNDSDHNGNIDNLTSDFKIGKIIEKGIDITEDDIYLKYLYIDDFDNDNDNSLVYLLDYLDTTVLLTGDISKNAEKILVNKYDLNNLDVLKVSHHGSKTGTSTELLQETLPRFAVISTNGNYNHPSQETITSLDNFLVKTFITKDCGTINLYLINKYRFFTNKLNDFYFF